jgi:hypothetical protein
MAAAYEVQGPYGITAVESVLVLYGVEQLTAAFVELVRKRLLELAAAHPTGVGYVHAQELKAAWRAPDFATRRAYMNLARDARQVMRAGLVVLDVSGFIGAAMRAIVSGMLLTMRAQAPIKIVSHFGDGGDWLATQLRAVGARS